MKQSKKVILSMIAFFSICLSQTQGKDAANVHASGLSKDSINQLHADSVKISLPKFDLISPAQYDSFITVLSRQGVTINKASIAAMGFSRDSAYSDTSRSLFVISIDENGQPQKRTYAMACPSRKAAEAPPSQKIVSPSKKEQVKPRQDGRVYFMINCALKSLLVYPSGLSMAFPNANGQVLTGVALLALGGSLYGSYAYTRNMELGYGGVEMMNYGGDLGVAYPLLAAAFLESSAGLRYDQANQVRGWGGMIGFPLGIFGGSFAKFAGNFEYGDASIMTSTSKFGFLYGFMIPMFFTDIISKEYLSVSTGLTMALIPAGFYVGKLIVGDRHYSSGRSVFITTSAIMGALTGALVPTLWEDIHQEVYAAATLVGHVAGTLYGLAYMNERPYTFGQGMFMVASAVVGTAVVDAFPLIAQSKDHQTYTVAGFVGSWGGLMLGEVLARALFEKMGRDNPKSVSVSFPGLWQAPLIWALSKSEAKGVATGNVPLVEVTF